MPHILKAGRGDLRRRRWIGSETEPEKKSQRNRLSFMLALVGAEGVEGQTDVGVDVGSCSHDKQPQNWRVGCAMGSGRC